MGASPTGSGVPEAPLSVKSAGASPPQSSGKHLHINLGNQFRVGGSLPNVNNNANCGNDPKEHSSPHTGAIHSIDLKVLALFRMYTLPYLVHIRFIITTDVFCTLCLTVTWNEIKYISLWYEYPFCTEKNFTQISLFFICLNRLELLGASHY